MHVTPMDQGFTVASILDPMPRFHVTLIDTKGTWGYSSLQYLTLLTIFADENRLI